MHHALVGLVGVDDVVAWAYRDRPDAPVGDLVETGGNAPRPLWTYDDCLVLVDVTTPDGDLAALQRWLNAAELHPR